VSITDFVDASLAATGATKQQIISEADKIAVAQLKARGDKCNIDWTWGVMDVGYANFSQVSPQGAEYVKAMTVMADQVHWTPLIRTKTPFNADDFCVGQMFLDLNAEHADPAKLAPLKARLDALVDHLNATKDDPKLTFWWCDALFMAPPVLARMSAITGDRKYIDAMDREFWRTTAALYDKDEHLFYRDGKYVNTVDENGRKIFWSRGNGWVLGGLASVLRYMPADDPSRPKYETLFKDMSARLITLQRSDGTWSPSLLDAKAFDVPETSGTSLFTYGLAWGINNHLLDRATYLPVVSRSWAAMLAARRSDDLPGFSQPPGAKPGPATRDSTQVYTTGGYLLAATELQKLAPLDAVEPATLPEPPAIKSQPNARP
jgi:rhamnogalacturonyl hydrolase YesR